MITEDPEIVVVPLMVTVAPLELAMTFAISEAILGTWLGQLVLAGLQNMTVVQASANTVTVLTPLVGRTASVPLEELALGVLDEIGVPLEVGGALLVADPEVGRTSLVADPEVGRTSLVA